MYGSDLSYAYLISANLSNADLGYANLRKADLRGANLAGTYLQDVDFTYANLDFSRGWKLACEHSRYTIDMKIAYQMLAHIASLKCDDPEMMEIKEKILPYAKKSHRAFELGLID